VSLSPWPWTPSDLFFEGSVDISSVVPGEFPCALGGVPFLLEPKEYKRGAVPIQRDPRDDSKEPGEQSLSPEGLWRRSQSSWDLGAGQEWLDEEESTRRRFNASLGIDVLTNERQACLLPETQEKRSSANSNLKLLTAGSRLYAMDGASLLFSNGTSSEQNATWVTGWTTATGLPGGNLVDMTYSGAHVYVIGSDNSIYRATPGTTSFAGPWLNPTEVVTRIWAVIGRLFVSDGANLYHVTASGPAVDATDVFNHPLADAVIATLDGGPQGVYMGINVGGNSEVRFFEVSDDGLTFTAPVVVASFRNETISQLAIAGNTMVVGTSLGFRFATISESGQITHGPAVTTPGAVGCVVVDTIGAETFYWFGWTNIVSGTSGLGRIRPARFTEPLVPAFASDIYSTGGGSPITCASLSGRRYFGISADGFFGPTPTLTLVASGTLSTGRIRYSLLDAKVFTSVTWRTDELAGAVSLEAAYDTGASNDVGAQSSGSLTPGEFSLGPTPAEWLELTFTLSRDSVATTTGPCLRWWRTRAIPAPETNMRIVAPFIFAATLDLPTGKRVKFDTEVAREFIESLVRSQEIVSWQLGHSSDNVYVVNYEERPGYAEWNNRDHQLESLCFVEMLTVD
jgi:hypothetical protein